VPAQRRLRPDGEAPPPGAGEAAAERRQEQAVPRPPRRSLDLAAEHADLAPQRQQLNRLRLCRRGADEREAAEPADEKVHQEEEHRAIVPTRCSWPTEYSDPTAGSSLEAGGGRAQYAARVDEGEGAPRRSTSGDRAVGVRGRRRARGRRRRRYEVEGWRPSAQPAARTCGALEEFLKRP
jgi:hypothetical protein